MASKRQRSIWFFTFVQLCVQSQILLFTSWYLIHINLSQDMLTFSVNFSCLFFQAHDHPVSKIHFSSMLTAVSHRRPWRKKKKKQGAVMVDKSAILLWGYMLSTSQGCGLGRFSVMAILVTFDHGLEGKPQSLAPLAVLKVHGRNNKQIEFNQD